MNEQASTSGAQSWLKKAGLGAVGWFLWIAVSTALGWWALSINALVLLAGVALLAPALRARALVIARLVGAARFPIFAGVLLLAVGVSGAGFAIAGLKHEVDRNAAAERAAAEKSAEQDRVLADARQHTGTGDLERAIASYDAATKLGKLPDADALAFAATLKRRGDALIGEQRFADAIALLNRAKSITPNTEGIAGAIEIAMKGEAALRAEQVQAKLSELRSTVDAIEAATKSKKLQDAALADEKSRELIAALRNAVDASEIAPLNERVEKAAAARTAIEEKIVREAHRVLWNPKNASNPDEEKLLAPVARKFGVSVADVHGAYARRNDLADALIKEQGEKETRQRREAILKKFVAQLNKAGVTRELVASVSTDGTTDITLIITVGNLWHVRHKQIRLQDAQALAKLWASMSPAGGNARIKLVDHMGNEVGGTGLLGGVDVAD